MTTNISYLKHTCIRWFLFSVAAIAIFSNTGFSQSADTSFVSRNQGPASPIVDTVDRGVYHYFVNGSIYELMGNFLLAAENYQHALEGMPQSSEIRMSLAEMLYQLQKYESCVQNLKEIRPPSSEAYELMGLAYRAAGDDDSAYSTFRQLVKLDSNNSTGYSFLASQYRRDGKTDSTIWAYRQLVRINDDNYRLPMELGRLLTDAGRLEEAKNSYRRALSLANDATTSLAWTGLAEIYQSQDSLPQAKDMYVQALAVDSLDIMIHRDVSALYLRLDSLPQATAHARKASELAPLDRRLSRRLGAIYFASDSLRLADSVFNWILNSGEQASFDLYYMGRIAAVREQYPTALDYFKRVAQMEDSMPESWIDVAAIYRRMQQTDQELETYRVGLGHMKTDSTYSRLLFALGVSYERNGQIDKATTVFEELIAKTPDNAAALNYLGYMLADKGQRLEYAQGLIQRAVKLSPNNGAYLDSYGWVLFRLGKYNKALDNLKKASELLSDPVIFDHLGDVYSATGNKDEARQWWQKALDLDPKNTAIQEKLAQ